MVVDVPFLRNVRGTRNQIGNKSGIVAIAGLQSSFPFPRQLLHARKCLHSLFTQRPRDMKQKSDKCNNRSTLDTRTPPLTIREKRKKVYPMVKDDSDQSYRGSQDKQPDLEMRLTLCPLLLKVIHGKATHTLFIVSEDTIEDTRYKITIFKASEDDLLRRI